MQCVQEEYFMLSKGGECLGVWVYVCVAADGQQCLWPKLFLLRAVRDHKMQAKIAFTLNGSESNVDQKYNIRTVVTEFLPIYIKYLAENLAVLIRFIL